MHHLVRQSLQTACVAAVLGTLLAATRVAAQEVAAQTAERAATPYKLTTGYYRASGGDLPGGPGLDLNLRRTDGDGNLWIGWFRSPALGFSQLRGGWDHSFALGPVRLLPSVQAASGGFFGGSIAVETGDSWFVGAGLGRTNLRNYANLNFDPNDSYTAYGGYHWTAATSLQLQLVRDNRLNPDQQHLHLLWRQGLANGDRLTVDLLAKQGTVDDQFIRRFGLSLSYDWPRWFVRAAWDPKVNFSSQNMLRLSSGVRF